MKIMYQVIIPENVHSIIDNFILSYRNVFVKLFNDTWLSSENEIIENYVLRSKKFQREIYYSVNDLLKEEKILWYSTLENKNFEITTIVWNYRLFIEYWEDNDDKIRFVENIRFFNK